MPQIKGDQIFDNDTPRLTVTFGATKDVDWLTGRLLRTPVNQQYAVFLVLHV